MSSGAESGCTLNHFIVHECRRFKPRVVRLDVRKSIHFNIEFSSNEHMEPSQTERSVTVNVSKAGCFLYYCRDWPASSEI